MKPYYQESGITIYHASCLDVMPMLESVDHVICDPPYSAHTHAKQWVGHALTDAGKVRCSTAHKGLGFDALTPEVQKEVAIQCQRICRRWCLFFSDTESAHTWAMEILAADMDYVRTCFWDKVDSAPQFTGDRPAASVEAIVCGHPTGRKRWNGGGRRNLFTHAVNGAEKGSKPHPSTKPIPLMIELVGLFTDPGELILDGFAGSGTTLVACKSLGRRAVGCEIDERHCETAARRLQQDYLPLTVKQKPQVQHELLA